MPGPLILCDERARQFFFDLFGPFFSVSILNVSARHDIKIKIGVYIVSRFTPILFIPVDISTGEKEYGAYSLPQTAGDCETGLQNI